MIRWLPLLLLVSLASGQEVCRHCPVGSELDAQFPEAPQQQNCGWVKVTDTEHGVYSYPIPCRKPRFFTKKWLAAEAIQGAASGFDIHETLSGEGRCGLEGQNGFPEKVGAGELAGQAALEWGFGWAVRAMAFRAPRSFGWLSYMTPGYATVLHLRGGIEWYNRCH